MVLQSPPASSATNCSGLETSTAMALLHAFGNHTDTSFGGQGWPLVFLSYAQCFGSSDRSWLEGVFDSSLPGSANEATSQDYAYTNMYLMSTINSILFGEIAGGHRGEIAANVGYAMFDTWYNYTRSAGVHEFTSPTYTHVQLSALYAGYIHARRDGYREKIGKAIDVSRPRRCPHEICSKPTDRASVRLPAHIRGLPFPASSSGLILAGTSIRRGERCRGRTRETMTLFSDTG